RRLPVAARERRQVRLRHDHRDDDRAPRETLETEDEPDLLGVGGLPVMVEDDVAHGAPLPSTPGGPCRPTPGPTLSAGTSGCGPPRPRRRGLGWTLPSTRSPVRPWSPALASCVTCRDHAALV